jgi:dephospho-CoA kinase
MRSVTADPTAMPNPPRPFQPRRAVVIGLLGGIAAGKSAVAEAFAAHGLQVIDADRIARDVVETPAVAAELRAAFGPGVADDRGSLRRAELAKVVFADPAARQRLEAITHPRIRSAIEAELAAAAGLGRSVLLDAPLLLEHGLIDRCGVNVFVDASEAARRERARARGWDDGELARRERAQAPLAAKRARAEFTIHNDGSLADLRAQVAAVLAALERR